MVKVYLMRLYFLHIKHKQAKKFKITHYTACMYEKAFAQLNIPYTYIRLNTCI